MDFTITGLLSDVDKFGKNFVAQSYQSIASALTNGGNVGVAGLLLTLYIVYWGFSLWSATAQGGPTQQIFRLIRAIAIYSLAVSWGDFQTLFYNLMNDGPSAIGNSMLQTVNANATGTTANLTSPNAVQNALQNIYVSTANGVSTFIKNLGVLNVGGYIIGCLVFAAVALLIGFCVFLIILSKIFMWLLLGLAPLFILSLLFGYTSRYFNGWITLLVQYFFVQVLAYAFTALFVSITQTYFDQVNIAAGSFSTTWSEMAPLIVISLIGFFLMTQITGAAASIAGGIPLQAMSPATFFSPVGAFGRMGARSYRDMTGTLSRSERLAARNAERVRLGSKAYRETAEFKTLSKKLSGTE